MTAANDHHRVCEHGISAGQQLARITEPAIQRLVAEGEPDTRCKSCAFRVGTVPNGCLQTQMDALKAVVEGVPFTCHQADRKGWPCHGWFAARVALHAANRRRGVSLPVTQCPWDFSPADEDE